MPTPNPLTDALAAILRLEQRVAELEAAEAARAERIVTKRLIVDDPAGGTVTVTASAVMIDGTPGGHPDHPEIAPPSISLGASADEAWLTLRSGNALDEDKAEVAIISLTTIHGWGSPESDTGEPSKAILDLNTRDGKHLREVCLDSDGGWLDRFNREPADA